MLNVDQILDINQKTWDLAAPTTDKPSSNLPFWGPYGIGPELNLLPQIENLSLFEIGCGSGRSMEYLLQNGAQHVTGLDSSKAQINTCRLRLRNFFKNRYQLVRSPMERDLPLIGTHDIAISIYALGWTMDVDKTLENIYSALKPDGLFIWSWEHPDFNRTWWDGQNVIYNRSYFDNKIYRIENFRNSGPAFLVFRKVETWKRLLRTNGFRIVDYFEPEPKNFDVDSSPSHPSYYAKEKALMVPSTMIFVCQKK